MMKSLRLRLPPLTCLLVFEAAARHGHFTRAAKELGVTPSAVSRQISQLEQHLGTPLFERSPKRILLTDAGDFLAARLRGSFEEISQTIHDLKKLEKDRPVIVTASTAFSHYWIVPRLSQLSQLWPEVRLRIEPRDPPLRLDEIFFDVGIFFGDGVWSGTRAVQLLDESVFPIVSKKFLEQHESDSRIEKLPLLQYESFADDTWIRWETWFSHSGLRFQPQNVHMSFRNYSDLINAVLAGHGVGLGWKRLLENHLAKEDLLPLGEQRYIPPEHYYLVVPTSRPLSAAASLVAKWFEHYCMDAPIRTHGLEASDISLA